MSIMITNVEKRDNNKAATIFVGKYEFRILQTESMLSIVCNNASHRAWSYYNAYSFGKIFRNVEDAMARYTSKNGKIALEEFSKIA
jgi:hypothetical protein